MFFGFGSIGICFYSLFFFDFDGYGVSRVIDLYLFDRFGDLSIGVSD